MNSIESRKSVRTFTGAKLTDNYKEKIINYITNEDNLIGINGNKIRFELREVDGSESGKIGTYGFIKNAPAFLIVICKNDKNNMIDCGYVFEKLILFLEDIGVNTCWLGGTFNRKQLDVKFDLGDVIPVISPLGYTLEKKSFMERSIRKVMKSNNRLDFDSLFFYNDFITKIDDQRTRDILELVRLAPSAANRQPWRVVIDSDSDAHFYIERTSSKEPKKSSCDLQMVDMGIALAHYEIASGKSEYFIEKQDIKMLSANSEYLLSVRG